MKYKLTHEELTEIFRRWSADVIAHPNEYSGKDATPEQAGYIANSFAKWYHKVTGR